MRKYLFKLSASAAANEFCVWDQVGIDVYIPHREYQVKSHSSTWFSADCAAAIVHRNYFRLAINRCERVLECDKLANLHSLQ